MSDKPPADDGEPDAALSPEERRQVQERAAPRAVILHETIRDEGRTEISRPFSALAFSGLAAGLSMGFSMMLEGVLASHLPETGWAGLVTSFGYCLGFVIVVLGRQQLFTESTLTAVLPFLYDRSFATFQGVMRVWGVVLVANLLGTILFALIIHEGRPFSDEALAAFVEIGRRTMEDDFVSTFQRAVMAGWLIALMVWLLPTAGSVRLLIIVILTYTVAVGRLAHVIAGSSEAAFAVLEGANHWGDYLGRFLLPTLLGNVLGGVLLVGILNHAAVASELAEAGSNGRRRD